MSDRSVVPFSQAEREWKKSVNAKLRDLTLRAYRGAVRTERSNAANPGVYTEYASILELVAPSGRWTATGTATFVVAAAVGSVDLGLQILASDPLTDAPFVGSDFDMPPARFKAALSGEVIITLHCEADLIARDNVKVALQSVNATGDAYRLIDTRLLLNPV